MPTLPLEIDRECGEYRGDKAPVDGKQALIDAARGEKSFVEIMAMCELFGYFQVAQALMQLAAENVALKNEVKFLSERQLALVVKALTLDSKDLSQPTVENDDQIL